MAKIEIDDTTCIANSPKASENTQWRFAQCFFNDKTLSCVEFNHDGQFLAVGSKCGYVFIYKRKPLDNLGAYKFYSSFQSHASEFDFLKSYEIEERINKIRWLQQKRFAQFLLSTNDKVIKLWKINECDKDYDNFNTFDDEGLLIDNQNITSLRFPRIKKRPLVVKAMPSRVFANLHAYNINSISLNSDQETFLSADELRINVWHLEVTNCCFNVIDIKPNNAADLTEIISSAEFHPSECNVFAYSTFEGAIRLCDMRSSALCERYSKLIRNTNIYSSEYEQNPLNYIKISPSGRYLMARDYMYLNIYDFRMENKSLEKYPVHDFLREKRWSLYKTQRTFDQFECCWSGNDNSIMTGTYNNFFKIFDRRTNKELMLEAKLERMKPKALLKPWHISTKLKLKSDEIHVDSINYDNKIQYTAWHPTEKTIAVAAKNNLFIYKGSS